MRVLTAVLDVMAAMGVGWAANELWRQRQADRAARERLRQEGPRA